MDVRAGLPYLASDFVLDFTALVASLPDPYLLFTADLRVAAVSGAYASAAAAPEPLTGKHLLDLFPDTPAGTDARDLLRASVERVLGSRTADAMSAGNSEPGKPVAVNYPVLARDGSVAYILHRPAGQTAGVGPEKDRFERQVRDLTARLEQHERHFQLFVRHIPAAVAIFDAEMRYLLASERWSSTYGVPSPDELVGRSHYDIFPDIPDTWKQVHRGCLGGETMRAEEERWERPGMDTMWVNWEVRPWGNENGPAKGLFIYTEDVTARKQLEDTLRDEEATIDTLLETAAQAILAVEPGGTVVLVNRMAQEMFGYRREELIGQPLEKLLPVALRERHGLHRVEFGARPRSRPMGIGLDLQALRKDGSEFPIEVSLSSFGTGARALAVAFVTDISARKAVESALRNSETELRALARSLLTAQEDERRRVARDLHDDVTQQLAVLSIEIGTLSSGIPLPEEELRARLRSFQRQTLQISNEVRRLSHGLHPSVIEDFGLSIALEEFCEEFGKAQRIQLTFEGLVDEEGLTADKAASLYRIAQESLSNAVKHARATEIRVFLSEENGTLRLVIADNGTGFLPGGGSGKKGLGWVSIMERIKMIGGTLSLASEPGRGTEITVCVPLTRSSN